jgi:hypothetical protein
VRAPLRFNGAVPWCAACDRFLSPATVRADGTCPVCGRAVEPGRARRPEPPAASDVAGVGSASATSAGTGVHVERAHDDERLPIPWHLWLLLAALAVYLGYRAFQGVEWVLGI